jgi:hypothetical protein
MIYFSLKAFVSSVSIISPMLHTLSFIYFQGLQISSALKALKCAYRSQMTHWVFASAGWGEEINIF